MQEQLTTGTFTGVGQNRPASLDGWMAQPLGGDDDAVFAPPAEAEPKIAEKRQPLALRVLQSVGGALSAIFLSGPSTNCSRCNASVDRNADVNHRNPFDPSISYHCRCCGQSWEQYLFIDPYA